MQSEYAFYLDKSDFSAQYYVFIIRPESKRIRCKYLLKDNFAHNIYGPATYSYAPHDRSIIAYYCSYGRIHNLNGPAKIFYNTDGTIKHTEYWIKSEYCYSNWVAILFYNCDQTLNHWEHWDPRYPPPKHLVDELSREPYDIKYWRAGKFMNSAELKSLYSFKYPIRQLAFIGAFAVIVLLLYKSSK